MENRKLEEVRRNRQPASVGGQLERQNPRQMPNWGALGSLGSASFLL
jgi:hypothetical protein